MNLKQITQQIKQKMLLFKEKFKESPQKFKLKVCEFNSHTYNFALENYNKHKKSLFLLGSILLCEAFLLFSFLISKPAINYSSLFWYDILFKPAFNPPVWLSQAIWGIIYLLMGVALYFILNSENIDEQAILDKLKKIRINPEPHSGSFFRHSGRSEESQLIDNFCGTSASPQYDKKIALTVFGVYLFLSVFLIPVFFGLKSTLGALVIAFLMFLAAFTMLYKFYKIIIPASLLMVPSVLWSAYLVGLSFTFWLLNNTQWLQSIQ